MTHRRFLTGHRYTMSPSASWETSIRYFRMGLLNLINPEEDEEKKRTRRDTATATSRRVAGIQRRLMAPPPFPRSLPLVAVRALGRSFGKIKDMKNSKNRDIVLIVVWLFVAAGVYGSLMSRPGIHGAGSMILAAIGGVFSATLVVGFMSRKSW